MRDHLRSARLRYTAMTEDDLPLLATWDLDGATLRQLDSGPGVPRNVTQLGEWMRGSQARKDGYLFALRPLDSDEMLGYIELDGIQWSHGVTWFSILIGDPANRGKGYGSEALEWLLRFAFHELNLYRVQLSVFAYSSTASCGRSGRHGKGRTLLNRAARSPPAHSRSRGGHVRYPRTGVGCSRCRSKCRS
ncbi:MAG: GNAT family N-acetyltransferase [Chloroflexi bacterium]|nr:MAG: GNAT family N-acetyltransferase [Chloroflexota bacterium]